jgi:hypothetical protein
MIRNLLWSSLVFLLVPGWSAAQKMEPSKYWEVGDKATYIWTHYSKSEPMEEEVLEVSDAEIIMVERRGSKSAARVFDLKQGGFTKYLCWTVSEQCTFSAANRFADFPLEKGKRWSNIQTVHGETFQAELSKEHKVEGFEKVKVPAGEFEACKISFVGRLRGKTTKGNSFAGTEKATYWYALVNGKPNMIKVQYSNSFPDKVTKELVSVSYK